MNKQELINHIKDQNEWSGNHRFILIKKEELISMIEDLDQLQKVKVPEEFDEWYQQIKLRWHDELSAKEFALWKICQFGFSHGFKDVRNNRTSRALSDWVCWNKEVAINAVWNGYEVEEEPKYYIKEPVTGQFLVRDESQSKGVKWVDGFSTHPSYYTEAEIEAIEPSYLQFKVPVEKV